MAIDIDTHLQSYCFLLAMRIVLQKTEDNKFKQGLRLVLNIFIFVAENFD